MQSEHDASLWGDVVDANESVTFADNWAWSEHLSKHFSMQRANFLATRDGKACGGLGLFVTYSIFTGRHAASGPLSSSGGGFLSDSVETEKALITAAENLRRERDLNFVEIYLPLPLKDGTPQGWVRDDRFVYFLMDISGGSDFVWHSILRGKNRTHIRKANKFGFRTERGHHLIESFSDLLHNAMKELGSPCPDRRFFEDMTRGLKENFEYLAVFDGQRPVAGTVLFFNRDRMFNPWAVSLKSYRPKCVNSYMYWKAIELGCQRGFKSFDLGRSLKGSGTYSFKRGIMAEERPLYYYYCLKPGIDVPFINPGNKKFSLVRNIWRRSPDVLTKALGNRLLRELF
jgi:FemAB-related protein (PEP-CTERM system-associated)